MRTSELSRWTFATHDACATLFWWPGRLPLDDVYPGRLDEARAEGKRLAQVALLQGSGHNIIGLFVSIWRKLGALHIDRLYILVDPSEESVRRWMRLGFKRLGWPERTWYLADDKPVTAMVLDVSEATWTDAQLRRIEQPIQT